MHYVTAYGGLCNRLRVAISWRHAHGEVTVGWAANGEIAHERYEDAFQPIPGVTFADPDPSWPVTCDPLGSGWERGWLDVKLRERWYPIVGAYSAMHVRRTDCEDLQRREGVWEPDEAFLSWSKLAEDAIYLATDNGTTQLAMMVALRKLGKHVLVHDGIGVHDRENEGGVRNTSLRHAWCDILACVGARSFRGSGSSSFTTTIETLRRLKWEEGCEVG